LEQNPPSISPKLPLFSPPLHTTFYHLEEIMKYFALQYKTDGSGAYNCQQHAGWLAGIDVNIDVNRCRISISCLDRRRLQLLWSLAFFQ
jgi:hypothetical protein